MRGTPVPLSIESKLWRQREAWDTMSCITISVMLLFKLLNHIKNSTENTFSGVLYWNCLQQAWCSSPKPEYAENECVA